jgi:putative transposase
VIGVIFVGGRLYGVGVQMRYRYRIEPTPAQQKKLSRIFGCCRVITLAKTTAERGWLREVPSVALVQSVNDARRAFRNFFDSVAGKRRGRKVGPPRFKRRKSNRQSFRLTRNGFRIRPNGRLEIAKIGGVAVRWSRELPSEPSSVTIIREPDGHYYATFVVEVPNIPLPMTEREVGVDLGLARLASIADTSGGCVDVDNPRYLQRKSRRLARLQREMCRRRKGSKNRDKARRMVAIQHGKVARSRRDHHHKEALTLVRENQAIYVEDLNIAGMVCNRSLGRAISDAGWSQFVKIVGEKCDRYGRTLHRVSRWLASSKTCSDCGYVLDELALRTRAWQCPACCAQHDRDHNAAKNVLAAGRAERLIAGGALVSPPTREARGDEAGSTSTAA